MAYTTTYNNTFTVTHADYIASKIAADLYQMFRFYGSPSEQEINNYIKEISILLAGGYLKSIDYGFKRDGKWILALCYSIDETSGLLRDDNAGKIPFGVDISNATWGSFLWKNSNFESLSGEEKNKIIASIPVNRSDGSDPKQGILGMVDKVYSAGGVNANRSIISKTI